MAKKPVKLIAIYPNGIVEEEYMDKIPELKQLQKIVGGYIEIVPYWNKLGKEHCVVFCNENGKINQLAVNHTATLMWYSFTGMRADYLVGGIAIIVAPQHMLREM